MNRKISVICKNDLSAYLGDRMNMLSIVRPEEAQYYRHKGIPVTFESFYNNTYDLSLMLAYLDDRLRVLEEMPLTPNQFNYQAFAETKVFVKACYLFFRILLDNISGIMEYFYKKNEPEVRVSKSFNELLKKFRSGSLPDDLSKLLEQPSSWFPEMKRRRDDLVHEYDSFLISIEAREGSRNILRHVSTKARSAGIWSIHEDIREYFGFLLCEYQKLIDNLLDHFDTKFRDWYGIIQGKSGRTMSIMEGCAALPLWWAYKYGSYRHKDLQVSEG